MKVILREKTTNQVRICSYTYYVLINGLLQKRYNLTSKAAVRNARFTAKEDRPAPRAAEVSTTHVSHASQGLRAVLAGQGFCFCSEKGSTPLNTRDKKGESLASIPKGRPSGRGKWCENRHCRTSLVAKGPGASALSFPSLFPELTISVLLKSSLVII